MKKLTFRFTNLLIVMGLAAIFVAAQAPIGYVLEVEGKWVLNGNALSPGEKVPFGGTVRRQSSSREDRITILDMRGQPIDYATRNCSNGCGNVINLRTQTATNSLWERASAATRAFISKTMESFSSSPLQNDENISRGGELTENVVRLIGDKIDLNSVLKPQGEQYLRWRTVSQKINSKGSWTKPIKLDKTLTVSGFQPGLYEINLVRSNGSNFEPMAAALILVTAEADYEKTAASFQEAQKFTESWGAKIRPETKRIFLKVSLDNLAQGTTK